MPTDYHKSFLSREPVHTPRCWLFGKGISAGGRAEDGLVTTAEDKASRLHLELRSPKFQLLLFLNDRDRWDVFETLVEQTRTRFQDLVRIVWIGFQSTTVPPTSVAEIFLHDHHGELHHSYGATESVFYLVRPDGYIATRDVAEHSSTLFEYLEALKSS